MPGANPLTNLVDPLGGLENIVLYPTAYNLDSGALLPNINAPVNLGSFGTVQNLRIHGRKRKHKYETNMTVTTGQGIEPLAFSFDLMITTDHLDVLGGLLTGTAPGEMYRLQTCYDLLDAFLKLVYHRKQGSVRQKSVNRTDLFHGDGILENFAGTGEDLAFSGTMRHVYTQQRLTFYDADYGPTDPEVAASSASLAAKELDEFSVIPFGGRDEIWAVDPGKSNPALVSALQTRHYGGGPLKFIQFVDYEMEDPSGMDCIRLRVMGEQHIHLTIGGFLR